MSDDMIYTAHYGVRQRWWRTWTHLTTWRHGFRGRFLWLSVEVEWSRWPRSWGRVGEG